MVASPYKNSNGVLYTKALFIEHSYSDPSRTLYTLGNEDHPKGYISLYKKYLEADDPTEWAFANLYFDSWEHWELITKCSWFKPIVTSWRKQLELKILSEALARLRSEAKSSTRDAFAANKFLIEKKWLTPAEKKAQVGRPSKEAIKREAHFLFTDAQSAQDDYDRILAKKAN